MDDAAGCVAVPSRRAGHRRTMGCAADAQRRRRIFRQGRAGGKGDPVLSGLARLLPLGAFRQPQPKKGCPIAAITLAVDGADVRAPARRRQGRLPPPRGGRQRMAAACLRMLSGGTGPGRCRRKALCRTRRLPPASPRHGRFSTPVAPRGMEGRQKDTRPSRPVLIMAPIRIFLITHRRPQLLRRSLGSLLAQTCKDWVCELHNDAPDDDAPWTILNDLAPGDPRLSYFKHSPTWGAVAVFNRVFRGGAEPFASMLEDDNWWEPGFLGTAMDALNRSPGAVLAWANMRMWKEEPGGKWLDLGGGVTSGEAR